MTAYNFKPKFADMVKAGTKYQTIRRYRKGHNPIPREIIQLYRGMRTKACKKIKDVRCIGVDKIWIEWGKVNINGNDLEVVSQFALAEADGFDDAIKFFEFFRDQYGFPFEGILIRWEDL